MFKEINLRNHSSLHKLFYSLKDNTDTSFEVEHEWLSEISSDIKEAMTLNIPYILNYYDSKNKHNSTLILPTENIKYISILDDQNEEHKNENT